MQEAARDAGSVLGSGRSPGGGNGYPLQFLAWRIPWTEEPGWLQSMGRKELDTTEQLSTVLIRDCINAGNSEMKKTQ